MLCKDLDCVLKEANDTLKANGIPYNVNSIAFEPLAFSVPARYENGTVYVNTFQYEEISNQSGGEALITSSYLLLVILYAVLKAYDKKGWKDRLLKIVSEKYGKDSVIYRLIEIVQL